MDSQDLKLQSDIINKFQHIDAKITIRSSSIGFVADFSVQFIVDLICARCLEIFSREFSTNLHLVYVKGKDSLIKIERVKLKPIDIDKIYYTGSQIDVSIGIREAIVLAIPIAPVCRNNCRGLCPICGKNRNKYTCECTAEKVGLFTPSPSAKQDKRKTPRKK